MRAEGWHEKASSGSRKSTEKDALVVSEDDDRRHGALAYGENHPFGGCRYGSEMRLLTFKPQEGGVKLKKLMLLAALLAMVVVAAVPAIAQVSNSNEQENASGNSSQTFNVTGGGDNSNACQGIQGVSNTGNYIFDAA